MNFYSKKGILLLVQIDHLSGELIGNVIESFYQAGAKNVQVLSTLTKKNRPGHILLIDASAQTVEALEKIIVEECGSSGWHRIDTCHRHTDVFYLSRTITFRLKDSGEVFCLAINGKQIADDTETIRPEYDSCLALQQELKRRGKTVGIRRIQRLLENVFSGVTEVEVS